MHQPQYDDWPLPKGSFAAASIRWPPPAGKRLDNEHYDTVLGPKAVEFWAMQGPDSSLPWRRWAVWHGCHWPSAPTIGGADVSPAAM
jgi:hypothetical protein